ncbi:MAG: bifunctional oligoribonuclease/PAP phosphatase NrnA [Planctomycetales bacterium]
MNIDWEPLREIIASNQRFTLSSHVRPDADALGSELALARMLESQGKSVRIVNPSDAPASLAFLDSGGRVLKFGQGITAAEVQDADVHVILDTSSWSQLQSLGTAIRESPARKVVIDHHVSRDDLGAVEFKDTRSEATGALVLQMAEALGLPIDDDSATYLFCAIATDTGWFRFPSTTSGTMRAAARLIDLGAEPHAIYRALYEQRPPARLKLAGRVLSRVELACDGRLAYTWVEWNDFVETGARPVDTEDLVNECLMIAGTQVAFIAVEQIDRRIKVSLRSRTGTDVAAVAERFGGGGHKQAAGAILPGPPQSAIQTLLAALKPALQESGTSDEP